MGRDETRRRGGRLKGPARRRLNYPARGSPSGVPGAHHAPEVVISALRRVLPPRSGRAACEQRQPPGQCHPKGRSQLAGTSCFLRQNTLVNLTWKSSLNSTRTQPVFGRSVTISLKPWIILRRVTKRPPRAEGNQLSRRRVGTGLFPAHAGNTELRDR